MKIADVRKSAYSMPLTNPAYPPGPYRFYNREFMVVAYRTDPEALRAVVPEPLEIIDPIVKWEFIRMPDSTGFGDEAPIAGGREIWGFPKKLAAPKLSHENEVLVGELHYGSVLCAVATMGYKHKILPAEPIMRALDEPNYVLKIIPHVDGGPRICEIVRYHLQDVDFKGAWSGPAALELFHHAIADVARLPVLEVLSGAHFIADLTLGLGEVVYDYLDEAAMAARYPASHTLEAAK
jgi:acetoacetate decarboxylase